MTSRRMAGIVGSLWRELVRPRGHVRHRFYRVGRSSRAGIALLMAICIIMLLTILVTEISHDAIVRVQMAANQRDEAKAEALAFTGIQLHRLVLVASHQVGKSTAIAAMADMFGMNANTLWQMVPTINSKFARILFVVDGESEDVKALRAHDVEGQLTDRIIEESREETSTLDRNFLDFDGDFVTYVVDEDSKIFVGDISAEDCDKLMEGRHAGEVYGLMSGEAQDQLFYDLNMDRWELISNLADWNDVDNDRVCMGGGEDLLYQRLENPYLPKNTGFDTMEEIRLVDGWHLDEVWSRFGENLTIYGKGKVNVNTAPKDVIRGLLMAYTDPQISDDSFEITWELIQEFRNSGAELGGGIFSDPQAFYSLVESLTTGLMPEMKEAITVKSEVFKVTSVGGVGEAIVKVEAVFDFGQADTGKVVYWRIR